MKKQNRNPDHHIIVVGEGFRKHRHSRIPGGVTLVFEYRDGSLRAYDNIHNIQAYVNSCDLRDVVTIWAKGDEPTPGTDEYSMILIESFGPTQHPKTEE